MHHYYKKVFYPLNLSPIFYPLFFYPYFLFPFEFEFLLNGKFFIIREYNYSFQTFKVQNVYLIEFMMRIYDVAIDIIIWLTHIRSLILKIFTLFAFSLPHWYNWSRCSSF